MLEYNKKQFTKTSDRKVLHKVKKHWVVLSTALLMALAGGATVLGGSSVHASTDGGQGQTADSLKSQLNNNLQNLQQVHPQTSGQSTRNQSNAISQRASVLHNKILANAVSNGSRQGRSVTGQTQQNQAMVNSGYVKTAPDDPNLRSFSDVPVTVKYLNSNGQIQLTQSDQPNISTEFMNIKGDVGSTVHPQFQLDPGYEYASTVDEPSDFDVKISNDGFQVVPTQGKKAEAFNAVNVEPDDNWDSSAHNEFLNGDYQSVSGRPMFVLQATDAKDIHIHYLNESGFPVQVPGQNYIISGKGRYGDSLDLLNPKRGGYQIPGNHGKSDFSNGSDYKLDSDLTLSDYTFGSDVQNVTVPLEGKKFASDNPTADKEKNSPAYNYLTVDVYAQTNHRDRLGNREYLTASDQLSDTPTIYKQLHKYIGGQIGNFTKVDPHDLWLTKQLPGYQPVANSNTALIYFAGNGHGYGIMQTRDANGQFTTLKGPKNSDPTLSFSYVAGQYTGNAKDINLKYIDKDTNQVVGTKDIKGGSDNYGRTINVSRTADGGLDVPAGYVMDAGQSINYTFGSDVQTAPLYVHGNSVATNSGTNQKQNPLQIILERDYRKSDGTLTHKSDITLKPQIHGVVGQTETIDPSSYLENASLPGYLAQPLKKEAAQKLTFNGGSKYGTVTPKQMHFTYDVYRNVKDWHRIRIHYVSANPDGTDNLNGADIPGTLSSDKGRTGSSFGVRNHYNQYEGDKYYRENPPKGYQFDKVLRINGKDVSHDPKVQGITKYTNQDQDEVIEVIPKSKGITFHYVDQSNNQIYSDNESGEVPDQQAFGEAPKHTSRYGQLIYAYRGKPSDPLTPISNQSITTPNNHVINGYHVSAESTGHYFTSGHQDYYIMVAGNEVHNNSNKNTVQVHIHEEDPAGAVVHTYTVPDYVSGETGDNYTIDAATYLPEGYQIASGSQTSASGTITPHGLSNRSVDFYYLANTDQNFKDLKGIGVVYMDNGAQIGYNQISPQNGDYDGEPVDVTTRGSDGFQLPQGYLLDPDQNTTSSFSTNRFNQIVLQAYQPAKQVEGTFRVVENLYHNSVLPSNFVKTIVRNVPEAGVVGDKFTVDPNDFPVDGYSESNDQSQTGTFAGNGITPASTVFNYVATNSSSDAPKANPQYNPSEPVSPNNLPNIPNPQYNPDKPVGPNNPRWQSGAPAGNLPIHPSDDNPVNPVGPVTPTEAEPIYVQYYLGSDVNHPLKADGSVGNDDIRVDGYMGQTFSDITKAAHLPVNSILLEGQNVGYTIGDQEQQVDLHVEQKNAQAKRFPLTVVEESPEGDKLNSQTRNIWVNGGESDDLTPSDYNPDSIDFHLDSRDHSINVQNQNGQLNPSSGTFYYIADRRHHDHHHALTPNDPNNPSDDPSDANIRPITVNYIDGSDGRGVATDVVSDGYMGQVVDLTKAGAPVPNNYHLDPVDQNVKATFSNEPQTIDLLVDGNAIQSDNDYNKNALTVHYTLLNSDGTVSDNQYSDAVSGKFDSAIKFGPNDPIKSGHVPSDYHALDPKLDPSDVSDNIRFNSDGSITPASIHFTYEKKRTDSKPGNPAGVLRVNFINQDHQNVGGGLIDNHKIGDKISNIASASDGGLAIPDHYTLNPTFLQNLSYQFTINDAVRNIYVIGQHDNDQSKNMLTVHIIKNNQDGSQTSDYAYRRLNNNIGSDVAVSPSSFDPSGYQVSPSDSLAHVMINSDGTLSPNELEFTYDQNVNSDAGDIILTYVNQKGNQVGYTDVLSGQNNNGKTVDLTDGNPATNGGLKGEAIPSGYHLADGQQQTRTFGSVVQPVTLRLEGDLVNSDTANNLLLINLKEHGVQTAIKKMQIHERVGSDKLISPNQYAPQGYHVTASDSDANVWMRADHHIKPSTVTWNYDKDTTQATPLHLIYLNQANRQAGYSDVITGFTGQKVTNLTHSSDGGEDIPSGYTLDPKNQNLSYTLASDYPKLKNNTLYLHVLGDQQTAPLTIAKVLKSSDGSVKTVYSDYHVPAKEDLVGNVFTLKPQDVQPEGYSIDSRDKPQPVQIGNGTLDPTIVTFYYNSEAVKGAPVEVTYVNQKGDQIGSSFDLTGHIGDTVNAIESGNPIPYGYQLYKGDSPSNYNEMIQKDKQFLMIMVTGRPVHQTFVINVKKKSLDGHPQGSYAVPMDINSFVGSDFWISPFDKGLTPQNYHADQSDKSRKITINDNGELMPFNHMDYTYTQNYVPITTGEITIHYVTSNGVPKNQSSDIDDVSDRGISYQPFNISPYLNDIPTALSENYRITGDVYDKFGDIMNTSHLDFPDGKEDLYVRVVKNDDGFNGSGD